VPAKESGLAGEREEGKRHGQVLVERTVWC
jgi:hypothetical protein